MTCYVRRLRRSGPNRQRLLFAFAKIVVDSGVPFENEYARKRVALQRAAQAPQLVFAVGMAARLSLGDLVCSRPEARELVVTFVVGIGHEAYRFIPCERAGRQRSGVLLLNAK
jgi:hypothetical protein